MPQKHQACEKAVDKPKKEDAEDTGVWSFIHGHFKALPGGVVSGRGV